jgi:uncharacterized protein
LPALSPQAAGSARCAAIIVFCREPVPHRTKTRLIAKLGARNAAALADAFTLDALEKVRRLNARRIVIAGSAPDGVARSAYFRSLAPRFGAKLADQGPGSIGARMARVLEPYCDKGAVLIGTDTPSLPPSLLARSLGLLRTAPVVLGPSLDGGYYLVGVRGPLPGIFAGIRWGRRLVLARTVARLEHDGIAYRLGPSWYDVDRLSDLMVLCEHLRLLMEGYPSRGRREVSEESHGVCSQSNPCPHTARLLARLGLLHIAR